MRQAVTGELSCLLKASHVPMSRPGRTDPTEESFQLPAPTETRETRTPTTHASRFGRGDPCGRRKTFAPVPLLVRPLWSPPLQCHSATEASE